MKIFIALAALVAVAIATPARRPDFQVPDISPAFVDFVKSEPVVIGPLAPGSSPLVQIIVNVADSAFVPAPPSVPRPVPGPAPGPVPEPISPVQVVDLPVPPVSEVVVADLPSPPSPEVINP